MFRKTFAITCFVPCLLCRCVVDAGRAMKEAARMELRGLKRILRGF